ESKETRLYYFFFQAEDGIRDRNVTGVQTCALPIYDENTKEKSYALKNIKLEIKKGEFVGIVGHTGSGKSTLIQHLNGLLKPSGGKVFYNERDIFETGFPLRELRGKVGVCFQYPEYQLFEVTVLDD